MSEFEKLAEELELLAKSTGDGGETDEKIQAAADDGNPDRDGDGENDVTGDGDGDGDGDDDDLLGKSFAVRGDDGKAVRVVDATSLIKSLVDRVAGLEEVAASDSERREHLGKSMGLIADLLKSQQAEIAALRGELSAFAGKGGGRKTVLTVLDKPALTKSHVDAQPTGSSILAKALAGQRAGALTSLDVSRAEAAVNNGVAVPADILARLPE